MMALSQIKKRVKMKNKRFLMQCVHEKSFQKLFAVVREASHRTLGQWHYDGTTYRWNDLHDGNIAEMKLEGKTLMYNSLHTLMHYQERVHVITVNDYLARRDASWMGQIYHALGLRTGVINDNSTYVFDIEHGQPKETEVSSAEENEEDL